MEDVHNQFTLTDYFLYWEREKADMPFLLQPFGNQWETTTWQQAGDQARRIVSGLQKLGLQKGDHVAIISKNCREWIIADVAIMLGGFISIPLYPNLTAAQLRKVFEIAEVKALFVGKIEDWDQMKDGLPADQVPIVTFPHYAGNSKIAGNFEWNAWLEEYEPSRDIHKAELEDLWSIMFTSGTTGTPKGVMHSHQAPTALIRNEKEHNNLRLFDGDEHRFFSYLPLNHIAERVIVEGAALMTGGTISFAESLDTFGQNLKETRPTLFMAVPRIWTKFQLGILQRLPPKRLNLLLRIPFLSKIVKAKIRNGLGLDAARILLTGAAPTPDSLKKWFTQFDLYLQEVYAMTENCGGCTLMPRDDIRPGTVGKPLPNVDIKIDPGTGEVLMRAPWVMLAYYKAPQKSAEILAHGWLHTGDAGAIDADGFLRLTGRVSDTFKSSKGKFIVPAPIEWGFSSNTYIEQVCVVGLTVPQPLALVALSELGWAEDPEKVTQSLQNTLKKVNAELANYERVKKVIICEENWDVNNGLLTPTMKIRRNVLNQRYQDKYDDWFAAEEEVIWVDQAQIAAKPNV